MAKKTVKREVKDGGLSERALLVAVNISAWSGRKVDKKATDTANLAHKASSEAGKYHKRLLPGAHELGEISTIASQIRAYFYEQTLPWMSDGSRILPSQNYLKFVQGMKKYQVEFEKACKDFYAAYPTLKAEAQKKLGGLYDPEEYPEDQSISEKFKVEVSYMPMPDVKDFRTEISETEKKNFQRKMKEVEGAAMRECWERMHKVTKLAAERLAQPDAIFRDSLIENIRDMANLMPMLNVSNDKSLEKSRREILDVVSGFSPDELRENADARDKASKELADIEAKMSAFMGGKK